MLGDVHLGRFRLLEPLGKGGMGEVWLGIYDEGARPLQVAVKVLDAEAARSPDWRATFRNEVRAVASLEHPNIVVVHDYGEVGTTAAAASGGQLEVGAPYLVMEHVHGGTLTRMCGHMAWGRVVEVALGLLDALAHAHARGVLHRDLKPGNVLLVSDPEEDGERGPLVVKLTDFGLAHALDGDLPDDGALGVDGGTPAYMAPEQFQGKWREYGPWTDLYSLGCLLHFLVCGTPPWGRRRSLETRRYDHLYRELPPLVPVIGVPEGFEAWLRTLLARDPGARYQRAADAAWGLLQLGEPEVDDDLVMPEPIEELDGVSGARLAQMTTVLRERQALPTLILEGRSEEGAPPVVDPAVVPPLPSTWIRPDHRPRRRVLDAGLGLFGLRSVPMVGRRATRDALWSALARARRDERAQVVALHGPSGYGKSRLARWLCERAHEVGAATVLSATHSPVPGPGQGLVPMVSRHMRLIGLSRDEVLVRVGDALAAQGVEDEDEAHAMTEWLRPTQPQPGHVGHRALAGFLERLSAQRTAVVRLEDVQWGLDALRFALELVDGRKCRVVLVLTAVEEALVERPVESAILERLLTRERAVRLDVGPLEPEDRPALVREILGLEPELARRVEARTEGNPLFAVQLVAQWVQRRQLVEGEGGYRLAGGVEMELPDGLHQVWAGRVERLLSWRDRADALALELAATLGQDVSAGEWKAACALAGLRPAGDLVEALLGQRLVRAWELGPQAGWSFAHPMVRESVERRASEGGRDRNHHAVCARLVSGTEPDLEDRAARLGRHLVAAGRPDAALAPLLDGADESIAAGQYSQATTLLSLRERALGLLGVPPSDPAWGEGWLRRYQVARWRSRFDEAASHLDQLEAAATDGWEGLAAAAIAARGRLAHIAGDLGGALQLLERAEARAQQLDDHALLAEVRWEEGEVLTELARLEEANTTLHQALEDYAVLGDAVGVARCWLSMGEVARNAGRHEDAAGLLEWSRDLFRVAGFPWGEGSALNSLGDVRRYQGNQEEARALYRESAGLFRRLGSGSAVYPEHNLGLALLDAERYDEAGRVFEHTLEEFTAQGSRGAQAMAHLGLAGVAASGGAWERYASHLEAATTLLEETGGAEEDTARLAMEVARVAARAGEPARARGAWVISLSQWRALGRSEEAAEALALLGSVAPNS